jgi:hypothetical protein
MSRVEMDIETPCWSPSHTKWVFGLGIPMLIIYVAGFPISIIVILFKYKNKLADPKVLTYFLLLYQGLKHERFYWEIVNTFRKTSLLTMHVFITDDFKIIKALLGSFVLFTCSIIQIRLKPYKIDVVTVLEHREMISSILTLYGGLIFVQEDQSLQFLHVVIFF